MKAIANVLALLGILLVVYAIAGRFIGVPQIGRGIIAVNAGSGVMTGNALMLVAIVLKLWSK
ncbi:MAG: hypothetical protein ABH885_02310 [Candidatus Omnitrophota bacterium]